MRHELRLLGRHKDRVWEREQGLADMVEEHHE
jgi:hypothetical protein